MDKLKVSAKALKNCYKYHLNVCTYDMAKLRTILGEPDYYNAGVYGWNFDAWDLGQVVINSGYRNTFGLVLNDNAILREYEEKARALTDNCNADDSRLYHTYGDTPDYYTHYEILAKNYRRLLNRLRVDLEFELIDKYFND